MDRLDWNYGSNGCITLSWVSQLNRDIVLCLTGLKPACFVRFAVNVEYVNGNVDVTTILIG